MTSKYLIPALVGMMLLTGCSNTILTKYQDNQCVRNCDDPNPSYRKLFEQPVLQTAQMFVGEAGCWIVVGLMQLWQRFVARSASTGPEYTAINTVDHDEEEEEEERDVQNGTTGTRGAGADVEDGSTTRDANGRKSATSDAIAPRIGVLKGPRVLLLALPAICDILGTTLMNAGLLLVAASIYQMTRGALVLFVGLFSVIFLKRRLHLFQWVSLVGVVLGVAVVGLAGVLQPDKRQGGGVGGGGSGDTSAAPGVADPPSADLGNEAVLAIIGVMMIAGAQIFTATQFVVEEHILERWSVEPVVAVGWEGLFGLVTTIAGMIVLHFIIGRTDEGRYGPFDMVEGWRQWTQDPRIFGSSFLIMLSIGSYNFFGLSVTRNVSATARSTIDTCRTLFIWVVSMGLGWETFKWLQVVGFALLVYFTFLFNGLVAPPFTFLKAKEPVAELLPEEPIEHM